MHDAHQEVVAAAAHVKSVVIAPRTIPTPPEETEQRKSHTLPRVHHFWSDRWQDGTGGACLLSCCDQTVY